LQTTSILAAFVQMLGDLCSIYIIHCLAKLKHQLQVCPEVTNSAWSYQCLPDFLQTRTYLTCRLAQARGCRDRRPVNTVGETKQKRNRPLNDQSSTRCIHARRWCHHRMYSDLYLAPGRHVGMQPTRLSRFTWWPPEYRDIHTSSHHVPLIWDHPIIRIRPQYPVRPRPLNKGIPCWLCFRAATSCTTRG
jgi:hypothetical protein